MPVLAEASETHGPMRAVIKHLKDQMVLTLSEAFWANDPVEAVIKVRGNPH